MVFIAKNGILSKEWIYALIINLLINKLVVGFMNGMELLINYILRYVALSEEEQIIFLQKVTIRKYLKGHFVVQSGEICQYESFVISGCLKTFLIDDNGREHIACFAVDNWWAGDLGSFINQSPANYNVQCLENSVIARISYHGLEDLYERIPKLERFFRINIQRAFVASQKRVIDNFSMSAKDRYLEFRRQYPNIEQRVPQYMIASYLGITKEFLSKIRQEAVYEETRY
jgi:CRP-like cAMP-binding protein